DDTRRWIDRTFRQEAPGGARVEILCNHELSTNTGWPMRLVEAKVGGELFAAAFYAFQEHGASAVARFADEAALERHRDELQGIFAAARPDFTGAVSCLAELSDIVPTVAAAPAGARPPQRNRPVE